MRTLVALAVALFAGCGGAAIQGKVHVGPGQDGLAVFAVLWQSPTPVVDPNTLVELGPVVVGTATSQGGAFDYTFHSLDKGTYVVGAFLADAGGNVTGAVTENLDTPIAVDPADPAKSAVTQDVFLGMSTPDRATVRGTFHVSPELANEQLGLFVLDRGLLDGAKVVASAPAPQGSDSPYAIFNVPASDRCTYPVATTDTQGKPVVEHDPCALHVVAIADPAGDADGSKATYAFAALNPITTAAGKDTQGVDLWLGRQSPDLGSISGTFTFNAALPNLAVQLVALTPDYDAEAVVNVSAPGAMSAGFSVPSLKPGSHFLAASVSTVDPDGTPRASSYRVLQANGQDKAVVLSGADPNVKDLQFPLGVGRVSGTVRVTAPASPPAAAYVFALPPAGFGPTGSTLDAQRYAEVPLTFEQGTATARYVLFGVEDGDFTMQLIPSADGSWAGMNAAYGAGQVFDGAPLKVTIAGGGRATSDFSVDFSH